MANIQVAKSSTFTEGVESIEYCQGSAGSKQTPLAELQRQTPRLGIRSQTEVAIDGTMENKHNRMPFLAGFV